VKEIQTELLNVTVYGWIAMLVYWLWAGLKTKRTLKRQSSLSRVIYLVLMLGAFVIVYRKVVPSGLLTKKWLPASDAVLVGGLIICFAGIALAIVARAWLGSNWSGTVTIKKDHELITSGPYRISRHPIYTGMFFGLLGASLIQGELKCLFALVLLFVAFEMKMSTEEKFLQEIFPAYRQYRQRTKKLLPFIF